MKPQKNTFDAEAVLHDLTHYLPAQAPLKDFIIHHNTLHAFQTLPFYKGIHSASQIFGYKVSLSLDEYRPLYADKRIDAAVLSEAITRRKGRSRWRYGAKKSFAANQYGGPAPHWFAAGLLKKAVPPRPRFAGSSAAVPYSVQLPRSGHLDLDFSGQGALFSERPARTGTEQLRQFFQNPARPEAAAFGRHQPDRPAD